MSTPVVVSIGTLHPWNIAGIGLDAQVAAEYGVRSVSVAVGISAQDESGMREKCAVPSDMVRAQLESLPRNNVCAFRVGALFEGENLRAVARFLEMHRDVPTVVDPVFEATLGGTFANDATFQAFRMHVLKLPVILTPNIDEAQRLTSRNVTSKDEMIAAAHALRAMGPKAVLLKGGHLAGDPLDVLVTASDTKIYRDARLPMTMRGTGCTLAASLACELAKGATILDAVESARAYVRRKIQAQIPYASLHVAF